MCIFQTLFWNMLKKMSLCLWSADSFFYSNLSPCPMGVSPKRALAMNDDVSIFR